MTGLSDLMNIRYWLTPNPGQLSDQTALLFAVIFGLFIVFKILLRSMGRQYIVSLSRYHKEFVYRLERMSLTMGVLGFVWLFFAYEIIPFFSGRYWFVVWVLGVIVWAYYIFYYIRFEVPQRVGRDREREYARKYLPRKGKR
ncbi:hypothetical protein HY732_03440 [Candidatus Uhrbacteria bacterium]|nr:hypothetical protein [Candidatus Uhrbacteria bacterium]